MASLRDVRDILGEGSTTTDAAAAGQIATTPGGTGTLPLPSKFQLSLPTNKSRTGRASDPSVPTQGSSGNEAGPSSSGYGQRPLLQTGRTNTSTRGSAGGHAHGSQPVAGSGGISRELYALIGDSAPSLRLVREELGLDADGQKKWGKGKGKAGPGVKWLLHSFTPAHHPTTLPSPTLPTTTKSSSTPTTPTSPFQLRHYRPVNPATGVVDRTDPYAPFGREGEGKGVMEYTGWEYERWLADPHWSAAETAYLFSLLKEYDLRFLIVADRYAYLPPGGSSGQQPKGSIYPIPSALQRVRAEGVRKSARGKAGDEGEAAASEAGGEKEGEKEKEKEGREGRERRATRSIASIAGVAAGGSASPSRGSRHGTPAEKEKEKEKEKEVAPLVPVRTDVKVRTLEEIKHRYYWICRKLVEKRPAADEAVRQRMMKAYDFDYDREVARKKAANALFHLNKSEIQEQEALYVELKKMEQNERRYKVEREELMRLMSGIESGIFAPGKGGEGNSVFGDGKIAGIGVARGVDGVMVPQDKSKKRKRAEDGEPIAAPEPEPAPVSKKRQDPYFDERNNIYRVPAARDLPARALHQPAHLRSTKLPVAKTTGTSQKVYDIMAELGIHPNKLVMPTRVNVDKLEGLMGATQDLVDMKKQFDRMEQEVKTLRALAGGGNGAAAAAAATPVPAAPGTAVPAAVLDPSKVRQQRSMSIVSSAASESRKKK